LPNEPVIGSKTGVFPSCNTTPLVILLLLLLMLLLLASVGFWN
jgi:hypothetical protein